MIVTDVGGLKETIGDRGTGIVAKDGRPETIAEEIQRYFSDPSIKADFIKNIRLEKERLSWKSFAAGLVEFAKEL
jgi:glycosyltransferase involved in cell wall biosynthesis